MVNTTGLYSVHMKAGSCEDHDSVNVYAKKKPAPLKIKGERALCERNNNQITLKIQNPNYRSFRWNSSTINSPNFKISDTGTHQLIGIYRNGCRREKAVTIASNCSTTFYVPNAFSPNGDGINDQFCPKGLDVLDYRMRIYNPFGEKLFESTKLDECWDGTYKGQKVPVGRYMYLIKYKLKKHEDVSAIETAQGTLQVIK